ncbi:hypothetical protein ES711_03345 [Gelidibacter salicanalis]|uniref:DUF5667 domain-containing protein n=1 Tax=Gelidibacter salicanalis TaxID=291193 RepID=A0A5C7AN15_9FLAO|nr:hypothetical protein [Gelidibacter salicanalis]TXE08983.1 hypothetical protein ES711_03345 [Gelidibacter salicanalis]
MKIWIIVLFLSLGSFMNAQQVISNGKVYEVKGKAIFMDGEEITTSLLKTEKDQIFKTLKTQTRDAKRAEKAQKRLEKSHKKAQKQLKEKQKAQSRFNKAKKRLDQNKAKYEKLKAAGKLSPNADVKWIKKLDGYTKTLEKATRNLKRT